MNELNEIMLSLSFSLLNCYAGSYIYASLSKWKASTLFTIDFDIHSNLTSHPSPARWRDSANSSQNSQQKIIFMPISCATWLVTVPWNSVGCRCIYTWNLKAFPVPFFNKKLRRMSSQAPYQQFSRKTKPYDPTTSKDDIDLVKSNMRNKMQTCFKCPIPSQKVLQIFHQISLRKEWYANAKPIFLPAQSTQLCFELIRQNYRINMEISLLLLCYPV